MSEPMASIGHNNPPSDIEIFGEKMKELYPDTFTRYEKLLEAEARIPANVDNDTDAGKLGDFIKQLKSCDKSLNAQREEEKEVYLKGSRMVDGFFNHYRISLKKIIEKAAEPLAAYQKVKEDNERRKREEEAERKRVEAEEKLREEKRLREEADAKRVEAEEIALAARKKAEADAAEIKRKADADAKAKQDEIDALRKQKEEQEKLDAEEKRKLNEQIKAQEEELKQIKRDEKAQLKEVKSEMEAGEDLAHELNKQAKADDRESNKALDAALRADKQAEKLDALANKDASELARVRGMEGSVATIQTSWVGTVTDRTKLNISALWPHLKEDDIQIALNSWVKANPGVTMPGAFIREENKAVVR